MGFFSKLKDKLDPREQLKAVTSDPMSLVDPTSATLNASLIDPLAESLGEDSFTSAAVLGNVGDAGQHMIDAGRFKGGWDGVQENLYAANRDWTAAHPGAAATVPIVEDKWGVDVMGNLKEFSNLAGSVFGGALGPIAGGIAGAAAGWGLGSQFGEDEDYQDVYDAAGSGAAYGVGSGLLSGADGSSLDIGMNADTGRTALSAASGVAGVVAADQAAKEQEEVLQEAEELQRSGGGITDPFAGMTPSLLAPYLDIINSTRVGEGRREALAELLGGTRGY